MKELRKLLAERRRPMATTMPVTGAPCAMRLLSDAEIDDAKLAAFRYLEERAKREGVDALRFLAADPEAYDRERGRQVIFRALLQAPKDEDDEPARFFSTADQVRELDSVVLAVLLDVYGDVQEVRTAHRMLLPETVDAFVASGATDDSIDSTLSMLDGPTLRSLVRSLVARVRQG